MIENIYIKNYKSIRELNLELRSLNILIGANGVGKSNFISFFQLANSIFEQQLQSFIIERGIDNLLYFGRKKSDEISGLIDFDNSNALFFSLKPTQTNKAYIYQLGDYFNKNKYEKKYKKIEAVIRSIAPFFERFDLSPDKNNEKQIQLEWKEKESDMYLNAHNLSDGTLRVIALTTLLLQPEPPKTIIIDEPELGLHPFAINKLAGLIQSASINSQIIISTQSVNLINNFEPEDIIVVDRENNQSVFKRAKNEYLKIWLQEYSIGDLWEKNIIGGQP